MATPGRPRRPTSTARRAIILAAAADVFFENGFSASSIDMIIDKIGGSKRTIYNEFGSKEGLFTALVTELADEALAEAIHSPQQERPDLRMTLLTLADRLLEIYTSTKLVGVYRAIVTEATRFPDLAQSIYDKGPGRAAEELKAVLGAAHARGEIRDIDTATAADQFVGMMRDNLHLQIVLGLRGRPDRHTLRKRAQAAVELFLNGIAADRGLRPMEKRRALGRSVKKS